MTVAESMLNLACVGAEPRALVNCLNFGNPENPNVMWQLSEAVDGMAEACSQFNIPVVGGNVVFTTKVKEITLTQPQLLG